MIKLSGYQKLCLSGIETLDPKNTFLKEFPITAVNKNIISYEEQMISMKALIEPPKKTEIQEIFL